MTTEKVLVVAAHPDDEVLGCGGAIAKHVAQGAEVDVLFMADGVTSRLGSEKGEGKGERQQACREALSILGVHGSYSLDLPDNRMDELSLLDIVKRVEQIVEKVQPSIVYTHYHDDLNIDHRITCQAVLTACRPLPLSTVQSILSFEVLSSTEWAVGEHSLFKPQVYVDITEQWEIKKRALKAYDSEMRTPPHSRSMRHSEVLAYHRGYTVGVEMAEAFALLREIR